MQKHSKSKSYMKHAAFYASATAMFVAGCMLLTGEGVAGAAGSGSTTSQGSSKPPKSLIAQAKKEGSLVYYTQISSAAANQAIASAFEKAYPGITVTPVSASASDTVQKFLTNAQAGDQQADAVLVSYSPFYATAYHDGYLTSISKVVPNLKQTYPSAYVGTNSAAVMVMTVPNGFAYNTNLVPKADVPKSFADFAKPVWKGHIAVEDPNASPTFLAFWNLLSQKLGPATTKKIWANVNASQATSGQNAAVAQLVASGEAWAVLPTNLSSVQALLAANAPIKYVVPSLSTGAEIAVGVAKQAPHAAAAKLFAYWATSKAGQTALDKANLAIGPLDAAGLPAQYQLPAYNPNQQSIDSLLGIGPN
jgi:iron(III) transport system substrate-binding protein